MGKLFNILSINPGSTSTKIALFQNENLVFEETLRHSMEEISIFNSIPEQKDFRKNIIEKTLKNNNINEEDIDVVVGRGGLLKPIEGGTYIVDDQMVKDLEEGLMGQHASNLGGTLAKEIGDRLGIPSYIVDPVVVDEMDDIARVSGIPDIKRKSIFHALNQKAIARKISNELGKKYEETNLIIAHLGGGISVGAHCKGKVVDVANALDGEGPFTPERSGGLPVGDLIKMCFSGEFTEADIKKKITGKGGLVAYLGTNEGRKVEEYIANGNKEAKDIYEAMAYQVSKEIGAMACVLKGDIDAIVLTGGIAYSKLFTNMIIDRVDFISKVIVSAGEDEMIALAQGGLRVLNGEEVPKTY